VKEVNVDTTKFFYIKKQQNFGKAADRLHFFSSPFIL
jgi:hypothetical protein